MLFKQNKTQKPRDLMSTPQKTYAKTDRFESQACPAHLLVASDHRWGQIAVVEGLQFHLGFPWFAKLMLSLVGNHGLVSDMKNDGLTLAPKGMNDSHRCHQGVKVCFSEIPSNFLHFFLQHDRTLRILQTIHWSLGHWLFSRRWRQTEDTTGEPKQNLKKRRD